MRLNKKVFGIILAVIALAVGGFFVTKKYSKPKEYKIYEALIAVRSQNNPDPAEDLRTSLKAGDVLLVLPEGHVWSETERVSYLILKMSLTDDQAQELVSPDQKTITEEVPSGPDGKKEKQERQEILRTRSYRIAIEKIDPNFNPNILLEKQPFLDKVYDWGIVEKKPSVK